ncbi:MAG: DUF5677 domain-containing protein [Chloroflexota bacterium]
MAPEVFNPRSDATLDLLFASNERLSAPLVEFLGKTRVRAFETFSPLQAMVTVAIGKGVKTHGAILRLCRSGYDVEALVLLRTLFELAVDTRYVVRDSTGEWAQRWIDYDVVLRKTLSDVISTDPYFEHHRASAAGEDTARGEIAVEARRAQEKWHFWGRDRDGELSKPIDHWSGKPRRQVAQAVGWESHYNTIYRLASNASHPNFRAATDYVVVQDDCSIRVAVGPSTRYMDRTLMSAHAYLASIATNWAKVMDPPEHVRAAVEEAKQDFNSTVERILGPERVARAQRAGERQGDVPD